MGLGRNIRLVKRVAEQVDLNIVVATGLYTYDSLPHYFDYRSAAFRPDSIDALEEFFLLDIEDGIAGTGRPSGNPQVRHRQARDHPRGRTGAACRRKGPQAHRDPDLHPHPRTYPQGTRAAAHLRVRGGGPVASRDRPQRRHHGPEYLEALVQAGSTLGMDRFGVDVYCPSEQRIETVVRLCDMGWAGQLVLSHDAACHVDWFDEELLRQGSPNWHFLHLTNDVIPKLRECGVSEAQVKTMMVDTPKRLLDHGPGY